MATDKPISLVDFSEADFQEHSHNINLQEFFFNKEGNGTKNGR